MKIKITDTGLVNPNFTSSDVALRFKKYSDLTTSDIDLESKKYGEFRVDNDIELKVIAKNSGISTNNQEIPSFTGTSSKSTRISTSPIKLSLTVRFEKPLKSTTSYQDLPYIKDLFLLPITKGHKDIFITPETTDSEKLMSLYYQMGIFGKTDSGSTSYDSPTLHLNVKVDAISENESTDKLSYNLSLTILYSY